MGYVIVTRRGYVSSDEPLVYCLYLSQALVFATIEEANDCRARHVADLLYRDSEIVPAEDAH